MLFDRFSYREREGAVPEEEPIAEMPSEDQGYSFTLGTRQLVMLVAGYCFLCVLVFALGVVVGRATSHTAQVSEVTDLRPRVSREPVATEAPAPALVPPAPRQSEPKQPLPREAGPTFASTFPEASPPSKSNEAPATPATTRAAKPPQTPEVMRGGEPPAMTARHEPERKPEPRRVEPSDVRPLEPALARSTSGPAGDYAIQVSAFRSLEQASELKSRLSKKGYGAYVQSVDLSDKGMWHRVRIGYFRDKDGAERVAGELRTRENLPTQVLKR